MRIHSFFYKLVIILFVVLLTYFYAQYEKGKFFTQDSSETELLLKTLPQFTATEVGTGKAVNSTELLKGSNGLFVHLWGTWCAPCEREMPEFLKYVASLEEKGIKVLLVAVNDEEKNVRKFMSRFSLPKNATLVIDNENKAMDLFGTLKVPETFLFNANAKHMNKFIGPQEWGQDSYKSRLDFWLDLQNASQRKIETH